MGLLGEVMDWFLTASTWTGSGIDPGALTRIYEHLAMSFQSVLLAAALVMPVAMYIGHRRRFEFIVVTIGNLGRALPSFGVLGITFALTITWPGNLGFWATFTALVLLAIPPILTNTYIGIKEIDADTLEAARGMGMTEFDVLRRLELPLGARLIVSGFRIATVQVIATATLGAVAAWGGLGRYIVDGFQAGDDVQLLGGAILVAFLAILTEIAFSVLERIVTPRAITERTRRWDQVARPPTDVSLAGVE